MWRCEIARDRNTVVWYLWKHHWKHSRSQKKVLISERMPIFTSIHSLSCHLLLHHIETLTLSSLNLPLSSSSTTSRELLPQFLTCSGRRWYEVGENFWKIAMYWSMSFMEIFILKPLVIGKLSLFSVMWNDALIHRESLKNIQYHNLWP